MNVIHKEIPYKIYIPEADMPKAWLNLKAFLPEEPAPMLDPVTKKPMTEEDLRRVFTDEAVAEELNRTDREIPIPEEVMNFYKMIRPSPLVRAYNLERYLDTPAEIYYKYEGTNTSGSHKLNSAVPQAWFAKKQGLKSLTTETGAGQWGTALAMACGFYGLDLKVFMVKVSSEQKPQRKYLMQTYGASVTPSPSDTTRVGRKILEENPGTGGSLGCAISEAVEVALEGDSCRYALGSCMDHVLLHQSIIGLECKMALDQYDIVPDVVVGCTGGGSNFGGLIAPFVVDRIQGKNNIRFVAVEPASCPTLTRGIYAYDYGDTGHLTPLTRMYTLGSGFIPSPNHAGGLRYHGMNGIVSDLVKAGYVEPVSYEQTKVFEAATLFARVEGYLPAPESGHAARAAIDEALRCKETGEKKKILFCLTGSGFFDMYAYNAYNQGTMTDYIPTDEDLAAGFATIPQVD